MRACVVLVIYASSQSVIAVTRSNLDREVGRKSEFSAQPHLEFDVVEEEGRPTWSLRSTRGGAATESCGTTIHEDELPPCSQEVLHQYVSLSSVLASNPGNVTSLAAKIVLLGKGGPQGLSRCIQRHAQAMSAERPFRLIIDAQYENFPRCCPLEVMDGLMTKGGQKAVWATQAAGTFEHRSANGVHYVQVSPEPGVCSQQSPCPLVVQIAGGGELVGAIGDPWLLVQSACPACRHSLRALLVAPELPQDMMGEEGFSIGTSNKALERTLFPLVKSILENDRSVDPDKVFLLAQSRGVDTALRSVLIRPDIFSMAVLSGMFLVTRETTAMLMRATGEGVHADLRANRAKLTSVQFHLGDLDHCFPVSDFFANFTMTISRLVSIPGVPFMDLRLYPDSAHSVWYTAWNALHEVVWTTSKPLHDPSTVPLSCAVQDSAASVGAVV